MMIYLSKINCFQITENIKGKKLNPETKIENKKQIQINRSTNLELFFNLIS